MLADGRTNIKHSTEATINHSICVCKDAGFLFAKMFPVDYTNPHQVLSPVPQIYRNFGLGSSYAKVMKFGCLLQYSEYGIANKDFPDVPPRLLEDIYQVQMDKTVKDVDLLKGADVMS